MVSTKSRGVIALGAGILLASCVHPQLPPEPEARAETITFRNQSRDRIQVYVIGEKEDWLIGRLESLETGHLRLPGNSAESSRSVVLGVITGWSRNLQPRRDPRIIVSIKELVTNLPGEEWIFVNGQLQGPLRPQSNGGRATPGR